MDEGKETPIWNDDPQAWFGIFRFAISQKDYERATEAHRHLRRLGYVIYCDWEVLMLNRKASD